MRSFARRGVYAALAIILALPGAWRECRAKGPKFNVDFSVGWGGCYRPMQWTPVEIGISSNLKEPLGGMVTVSAQQDELTRMDLAHEFVLTPDLPVTVPLVTKFAFAADKCEVRIVDSDGNTKWRYGYELWGYSPQGFRGRLTSLSEKDMLIGLAGRRSFELFKLSERSKSQSGRGAGRVHLKDKLPRTLPWDWTGYCSLDLLVLYDPDWNSINSHQAAAIAQWVTNGGRLLVILGSRPLPATHPVAALLPFEIDQARQVVIPAEKLRSWGCRTKAGGRVLCWPLKAKVHSPYCSTKTYGSDAILFAAGLVGFGRVGVLAFNPADLKAISQVGTPTQNDVARFWIEHLSAVQGDPGKGQTRRAIEFASAGSGDDDNPAYSYQYETGLGAKGLNSVLTHLLSIPELRPLSIWWVIGLLTLLAVLLGPVDYFVLKRLDRLPLTWVTSAACITLFTVGAYYGVRALRAGQMQLRAVSVLDGVQGGPAWVTTYSGLFAPESREYHLEGLQADQWWSGIAPAQDYMYRFDRGMAGKNIYCFQGDGGNLPTALPINIWSMQCLLTESPAANAPISAVVATDGDEVTLTVTNLSDAAISRGSVRFDGDRGMVFGPVAAGETRQLRGPLTRVGRWSRPRDMRYGGSFRHRRSHAYFAQGSVERTFVIEEYLRRGAAVVCAEYDRAPPPFGVADYASDTNHVQLVRLVVFPKKGG